MLQIIIERMKPTQSLRVLSCEAVTILESSKVNEQQFTASLCPLNTLIFTYMYKGEIERKNNDFQG